MRHSTSSSFGQRIVSAATPLLWMIGSLFLNPVILQAQDDGLVYVDADDGVNGSPNLSDVATEFRLAEPLDSGDGLWNYRSDGGAVAPGSFFRSVYEASGGMMGSEDAPVIEQTISVPMSNSAYDVYVAYWQGAQPSHDWNVRAGFSAGSMTLFNARGPSDLLAGAIAGTDSLFHDWDAPPLSIAGDPLFTDVGRTLLLGKIGTTSSTAGGQITVFIDDLPATLPGASSDSHRTWFDGVAFVEAGTEVFIKPGDFNRSGVVDPMDAATFIQNLHTDDSAQSVLQTYLFGDLNGDRLIDHRDFVAFKTAYNADNGAGAFEAYTAQVPEPTSVLLLLMGVALLAAMIIHKRRPRGLAFQKVNIMSGCKNFSLGGLICLALVSGAHAAPVTGWLVDLTTGAMDPNKITAGANTDSPVIGNGSPDSAAGGVTIYAAIAGAIDAAPDISLSNGQQVTLSGSATFSGIASAHSNFRFGLFNEAGPTVDTTGWLGYLGNNSAGNTGGALHSKILVDGSTFISTNPGRAVNLQTAQDGGPFVDDTYDFSLTVARFGNDLSIDASLTSDSGWSQVWSDAIESEPSRVTFDFNRVGFLIGNPLQADQVSFSNIDVSTAAVEALTLQVTTAGPQAGSVRIVNNLGVGLDLDYYEIISAAGSLNVAGWNSLDDQEGGDPPTQGWDEAGGTDDNLLSEINLQGAATLGVGGVLNLGQAFDVGGAEDLEFSIGMPGSENLVRGIVVYGESFVLTGDYNGNGIVDAADYTVWRDNVGATDALENDEIGGTIGTAHYIQWKEAFGNSGGGSGVGSASVPEPTSLGLLAVAALVAAAWSRRCRRSGGF